MVIIKTNEPDCYTVIMYSPNQLLQAAISMAPNSNSGHRDLNSAKEGAGPVMWDRLHQIRAEEHSELDSWYLL